MKGRVAAAEPAFGFQRRSSGILLGTTALSVLGYEHARDEPVLRLWNDARPGLD